MPPSGSRPDRRPGAVGESRGVAGWLAFFCYCLMFAGPLLGAVLGAQAFLAMDDQDRFETHPALVPLFWFEGVWLGLLTGYGIWVGYKIWRGSPRGRRLARQYLVVNLAAGLALHVDVALLLDSCVGLGNDSIPASLGTSVARQLVFFGIWWCYFHYSRRVRNTYGAEEPAAWMPGVAKLGKIDELAQLTQAREGQRRVSTEW